MLPLAGVYYFMALAKMDFSSGTANNLLTMTFLGLVYTITGVFIVFSHQYQFSKTTSHYVKKLEFKKSQTNEGTLKKVLEPYSHFTLSVYISEVTSFISAIIIGLAYNYEIGIVSFVFSVFSLSAPHLINYLNTITTKE